MDTIGGFNKIVTINDTLYSFFKQKIILSINIIELFPLLKRRITTLNTIFHLHSIIIGRLTSDIITYHEENSVQTVVNDNQERQLIKEEERLSSKILELVGNLPIINLSSYDIYNLVQVAYLLSNGKKGTRLYHSSEFDIVVSKILEHPSVDPLKVSVLWNSSLFVDKYLKDVRSNRTEAYRLSLIQDLNIHIIIRDNILINVFFCKQIFSKFSADIYRYIILSEIL